MKAAAAPERVRTRIDALATAGLDWQTFGQTALDVLQRAMPVAAACFATVDPATQLVTATIKTGDLDDDHDDQWSFHEYEVEDVYDFRGLARRPGEAVTLHAETGGDPRRSVRYAEMFSPVWDFSDELRTTLRVDGVMWGALALFHDAGRVFSPAEADFVAGVAEGLGRGLRAGLLVAAVADLDAGCDRGPAVVVVDARGDVAQANLAAPTRITELGGGPLGGSPLPQVVNSLVAAARRQVADPTAPTPRARLRTRDGRWVVAHASPLVSRTDAGTDVVVTIDDARPPEIIPLVVASYGLTDRERDVVAMVLQGVDTADIARSLHLSAYTVQDHLKKVFAKVGVRSRRELIAAVFNDHYVPHLVGGSALAPSGWYA